MTAKMAPPNPDDDFPGDSSDEDAAVPPGQDDDDDPDSSDSDLPVGAIIRRGS